MPPRELADRVDAWLEASSATRERSGSSVRAARTSCGPWPHRPRTPVGARADLRWRAPHPSTGVRRSVREALRLGRLTSACWGPVCSVCCGRARRAWMPRRRPPTRSPSANADCIVSTAELDLAVGEVATHLGTGHHLQRPGGGVHHHQDAALRRHQAACRAGRRRPAGRPRPRRRTPRTRTGRPARPTGWPCRSLPARASRAHQLPLAPPVPFCFVSACSSSARPPRGPPNHWSSTAAAFGAILSPRASAGR